MSYRTQNSPRRTGNIIDSIHIAVGIAVTIMAGFAIFEPIRYMFLFPLIFFSSAVLSCASCWYSFITYQRNKRVQINGIIYLIVTVLLLILFVISAISIWGHN